MSSLANTLDVNLPIQQGGIWNVLISLFFFLTVDLVLYPIFGALGGMIGAVCSGRSHWLEKIQQ